MAPPTLWHLDISHYNEKVRWALDLKGVPHIRRKVAPGLQQLRARRVAGTDTLPVLELDGRAIGDSTEIIEEIERRWPRPPLYPADEEERRRALELEEFFDERCGHDLRRVLFNDLLTEPRAFLAALYGEDSRAMPLLRVLRPPLERVLRWRLRITPERVETSRGRVLAAFERIESEVGPSGYLVGDSFSIADLTAAAILSPLVAPPEHPYLKLPPERWPPAAAELHRSVSGRPGFEWVRSIYARHRGRSAEIPA